MLPYINTQNWVKTKRSGGVLVRSADQGQLVILVLDEPGPTAAKYTQSSFFEFCLEFFKAAKFSINRFYKAAGWLPAFARRKLFPPEIVMIVSTTIITNTRADTATPTTMDP